jgi:hypothetical protein
VSAVRAILITFSGCGVLRVAPLLTRKPGVMALVTADAWFAVAAIADQIARYLPSAEGRTKD